MPRLEIGLCGYIFAAALFNDTVSTKGYLKSGYVLQNNKR
jgi:hypothetical protein